MDFKARLAQYKEQNGIGTAAQTTAVTQEPKQETVTAPVVKKETKKKAEPKQESAPVVTVTHTQEQPTLPVSNMTAEEAFEAGRKAMETVTATVAPQEPEPAIDITTTKNLPAIIPNHILALLNEPLPMLIPESHMEKLGSSSNGNIPVRFLKIIQPGDSNDPTAVYKIGFKVQKDEPMEQFTGGPLLPIFLYTSPSWGWPEKVAEQNRKAGKWEPQIHLALINGDGILYWLSIRGAYAKNNFKQTAPGKAYMVGVAKKRDETYQKDIYFPSFTPAGMPDIEPAELEEKKELAAKWALRHIEQMKDEGTWVE